MSAKLLKVLTKPAKISSALDWTKVTGSILSMDIHRDRIGLAIASHPSFGESVKVETISIPNRRGIIDSTAKAKLIEVIKENRVCGIVVSWPLQQDTKRLGAACARVLNTLEALLEDSSSSTAATLNRPLCLWDVNHTLPEVEDEWGRCASYGGSTTNKSLHLASQEQYFQDENIVALRVWNDFMNAHWPQFRIKPSSKSASSGDSLTPSKKKKINLITRIEASSVCARVALL